MCQKSAAESKRANGFLRLFVQTQGTQVQIHVPLTQSATVGSNQQRNMSVGWLRKSEQFLQVHLSGGRTQKIHTAAMVTPYVDINTTGSSTAFSAEGIAALLKELNEGNLDLHLHTVGERASRTVLDGVEIAKKEAKNTMKVITKPNNQLPPIASLISLYLTFILLINNYKLN